jgi:SAM-dependent methyltransferase
MKRPLTGTIHPDDYIDIQAGVQAVRGAVEFLWSRGVRIDIPHPHRFWEYGTAMQMVMDQHQERLPDIEVLDVGSGWGAIGPALNLLFNTSVTECEPGLIERSDRVKCDEVLRSQGKKGIQTLGNNSDNLPPRLYDAVFCISVIEHMPPAQEARAWRNLIDRVKPGGLFFADVDCVPVAGKQYTFDNLRAQNFTIDMMKERVQWLRSYGMVPLGEPDFTYHGDQVHDFTFFRVGMMKGAGQ